METLWVARRWRWQKALNYQIIWNKTNFDAVDVHASDSWAQNPCAMCVFNEKGFVLKWGILSIVFPLCLLRTMSALSSQLEPQTLIHVEHPSTNWESQKTQTALAKFHGHCSMCPEDEKYLSPWLWAVVYQLGHLSLCLFLKKCALFILLRYSLWMMSHLFWRLTWSPWCIAQRVERWPSPLNTFLLLMQTVMT